MQILIDSISRNYVDVSTVSEPNKFEMTSIDVYFRSISGSSTISGNIHIVTEYVPDDLNIANKILHNFK